MNDPGEFQAFLMFFVAAFGLVVKIAMAFLLEYDQGHSHRGHDGMHDHGLTFIPHNHHHHHGHSKHDDEHNQEHVADHTMALLKTCSEGEKMSEGWS